MRLSSTVFRHTMHTVGLHFTSDAHLSQLTPELQAVFA